MKVYISIPLTDSKAIRINRIFIAKIRMIFKVPLHYA
ncbi:Uncharacterised protein [Paraprevotella clara]|uniref:Uncharacterized protein n=1 Tax=Paraprevotella clara TaxID=454154 RepID=A0A6N3FLI7_9BACT